MICLICRQAELVDGFTSVTFKRDEMRLVVKHVPARLCPSCGEACVDENIARQLLQNAEEISTAGMMEDVTEFGTSPIK